METSFGNFLREKRQEKNLTQKELAKLLFVSESAVSKWEKDNAHPDITLLPKLSEILGVTEHELITASIDKQARKEKVQAKRWRAVSMSWNLFFYISYSVAILTCFICNLAVNKTLSWFWIVLSALILSFTFTTLPQFIKKHRLILIPLSMYLPLCLLLGVCAIYTNGGWFFIASIAVLLGLVMIFVPIYIAKFKVFARLNKYNDFVSVAIDFVLLNILLIIINCYTGGDWYFKLALPIVLVVYAILNILLCVRFLKLYKLLKTSIILTVINLFISIPPLFIKVDNPNVQNEIDDWNIFKADFTKWVPDAGLDNNICCLIVLTMFVISIAFFISGFKLHIKSKNHIEN